MTVLRRSFRAVAYLYGVYLALVLLVLLPLMNVLVPRVILETTGRELRSEILLFNPFTLALELRGGLIVEDDGHEPLGVKRALLDLSIESLWQPGVVLDRVAIDELDVHVLRYADGTFHFDDLLGGETAPEPETKEPLPALTIQDLRVSAHTLAFTDRSRPGPYRTVHTDLGLHTTNLTTVPGRRGDGALELTSDGGGRLRWEGTLDLGAGRSEGRLELEAIDLTPIWRYERERLDFVVDSALLDLTLPYAVDWSAETEVRVDNGRFGLRAIDIRPADPQRLPDTGVRLETLSLDGLFLDLSAARAGADALALSGLAIDGFDEEGSASLIPLFLGETVEGSDTPEDKSAPAAPGEPRDPWTVTLDRLSVADSRVGWRTAYLSPDRLRIEPLSLSARDLAWPASGPSAFDFKLQINEQALIALDGALNTDRGDGDARLTLEGWPLAWLNPLVHTQARTDLERGLLSVTADAGLAGFEPQMIVADLVIDDLATVLHDTGQEAFSLERLALEGVNVEPPASRAHIERLHLQRPRGSLHILEDGSVNVNGIVRQGPPVDTGAVTEAVSVESSPDDASAPWRVQLSELRLQDGRLEFADDSLPLPFRTTIEEIEATVSDIDTAAETPLTVTLNGNVDGYAPVVIEGSGTPHGEVSDGRVRFRFQGVDIATMSPYSGTYAGYTIDSGTLSLDLTYALAGTAIDGDNRIVISQMRLGEPVESDLAVQVPLKLGLALLTDARGVIDLSVPVSGDVDDPEFSVGGIIGRALLNVITKAVTAPFRLLAGLVDSDADLENVSFRPGLSEPTAEGRDGLQALADALGERPQLNLRVIGATDMTDDQALREAALASALEAEGLGRDSITARDSAWAEAVSERYAASFPIDDESADEATEEAAMPTLEEQWRALVEATVLPPSALSDLGTARAAAAKRELVTVGGVDAARIAISYDPAAVLPGVHMELDG